MKSLLQDAGLRRKVGVGVVKAAIGSLLISFEFFAVANHGFTSVRDAAGMAGNVVALCVYALGFLLIFSAIKNCPFTGKREGSDV